MINTNFDDIFMDYKYPHVFEENVLDNIKDWVLNDASRSSCEDPNLNNDCGQRKSSDAEMLRTYSTGLLALCLAGYAFCLCSFVQKY